MRRMTAMAGAVALLGGCGDGSPPAPRPVIKVQGEEQKMLAKANELDRSIALKRAVQDAGSTCKRVTATGFVTDYKNMAMWQAACAEGKEWAIFIAANGAVQVRPCADLKELLLPECKLLDEKAADKKPAA